MRDILLTSCIGLPVSSERLSAIEDRLRDEFVTTAADVLQTTDAQFKMMEIPVGIANRLRSTCKRMTDTNFASAESQDSSTQVREAAVWPCFKDAERFLKERLRGLTPTPRDVKVGVAQSVMIPVACLRWSQETINSHMEFLHGDQKSSVYKLLDDLIRGRVQSEDVEPLETVLCEHNNEVLLFSEGNRRLAALLAYQALRRHSSVIVRCVIRPDDEVFRKRFSSTTCGWAVAVKAVNMSTHHGMPVFDGGLAADAQIQHLRDRHPEAVAALDRVLVRPSAGASSEHSLTLAPEPVAKRARVETSADVLLVYTPGPCARKYRREFWIFSLLKRQWLRIGSPPLTFDQVEIADPNNPRQRKRVWTHDRALFRAAPTQGIVYAVTEKGAWCCRNSKEWHLLVEQSPPHLLNNTSLIVPIHGVEPSFFLMTQHDHSDLTWSACRLKNRGWMPFRFHDGCNDDGSASCRIEAPPGDIISDRVGWRACSVSNLPHVRNIRRAESTQDSIYILGDMLYRIRIGSLQVVERCTGLAPHDILSFQGRIYTLGFRTGHSHSERVDTTFPDSVSLCLQCLSEGGECLHELGHVLRVDPVTASSEFRRRLMLSSQTLASWPIGLIAVSLDTGIFVFLWGQSKPDRNDSLNFSDEIHIQIPRAVSDDSFVAGWVCKGDGAVQSLGHEALQLPSSSLLKALKQPSKQVRAVGSGATLLLFNSSECALFDAMAGTWRDAPLIPTTVELGLFKHQFAGQECLIWRRTAKLRASHASDEGLMAECVLNRRQQLEAMGILVSDDLFDHLEETPDLSPEWFQLSDSDKRRLLDSEITLYMQGQR